MEQETKICKCCGEEINYSNTQTKAGWAEVNITGICEKCFDNTTFNLEENIDVLDEFVLSLIKDGVVLAGGSLRALVNTYDEIQDYDLFFLDESKVQSVKEELEGNEFNLVFACPEGKLFTYINTDQVKVQLILKRTYTSCQDIISSFDVTACCCAYDGNKFYYSDRFVFDNLNGLININNIEYPVATMKRIAKYVEKGFKLTSGAAKYFVEDVNTMELDDSNTALYID